MSPFSPTFTRTEGKPVLELWPVFWSFWLGFLEPLCCAGNVLDFVRSTLPVVFGLQCLLDVGPLGVLTAGVFGGTVGGVVGRVLAAGGVIVVGEFGRGGGVALFSGRPDGTAQRSGRHQPCHLQHAHSDAHARDDPALSLNPALDSTHATLQGDLKLGLALS